MQAGRRRLRDRSRRRRSAGDLRVDPRQQRHPHLLPADGGLRAARPAQRARAGLQLAAPVPAVVEHKPGEDVDADAIIAACKERLGSVNAPKHVLVRSLPRSAVGKVLKRDGAPSSLSLTSCRCRP
jgi:hypothetical protein